jgi:hypothetical protein
MITIGEVDTKVLQPLQKALWGGLGRCPQFCLTNGVKDLEDFAEDTLPWIYRIESAIKIIKEQGDIREENPVWLSGDYTAATDNFPMWATEALLEGILDCISHEPTKQWARWEISSHKIDYPGRDPELQTSGQLMGSLLSFPLLCLLNDFVMKESGFHPNTYLVNGDDVVARSSLAKIKAWRSFAPRVGLSLSMGKNFIDPDFCTVNSQLFYNGEVKHTGKVALARRQGTTIDYCFCEAQFYWGATPELKENFLTRNWKELSLCPRSLHFSKEHGGLGLVDTCRSHGLKVDQRLAKEVYLYDCISRFGKVHRVPGAPFSFVCFPLVRGEEAKRGEGAHPSCRIFNRFLSLGALENDSPEKFADLSHRDLSAWRNLLVKESPQSTSDLFRRITKEGEFNLEQSPSSDFLECSYMAVTNGLARRYAQESMKVALALMADYWFDYSLHSCEYLDYDDYPMTALETLFDDYAHAVVPAVQLFGGPEDFVDSEGKVVQKDVCNHWDTYNPDSLPSNCGGQLFKPRPQGFDTLDEFLSLFGHSDEDDNCKNDNCPADDQGPDEPQGL